MGNGRNRRRKMNSARARRLRVKQAATSIQFGHGRIYFMDADPLSNGTWQLLGEVKEMVLHL